MRWAGPGMRCTVLCLRPGERSQPGERRQPERAGGEVTLLSVGPPAIYYHITEMLLLETSMNSSEL